MGKNEQHIVPPDHGKEIVVTKRTYGANFVKLVGQCSANVTVEDIQKTQFDPLLGGSNAWVEGTRWGCIRNTE